MKEIKQLLASFLRWEYSGLSILVIATAVLHFSTIKNPTVPISDEWYYWYDAIEYIMRGNGTLFIEHPPLAKLFITLGMELFGENPFVNPFGLRFFSVIFGTTSVALFYLICRQLLLPRNVCFLATFLFAFENMSFIQASVAMLDVFSLAFMLLSLWLYLRGNYIASGVSIGLAALCKITGAFAIPIILLYWLFTRAKSLKRSALTVVVAVASFMLLRPVFDYVIWHELRNPISATVEMLSRASEKTSDLARYPELLSRSWDWIIHPVNMVFHDDPHYISRVSYSLWALIIPIVAYMTWRAVKGSSPARFALTWFIVTYFFWVFLNLLTDRNTYVFYFYFSIGALCIGLALMLWEIGRIAKQSDQNIVRLLGKIILPGYLLIHLASFAILIPVSYWWKVPLCVLIYVFARYVMDTEDNSSENHYQEIDRRRIPIRPLS